MSNGIKVKKRNGRGTEALDLEKMHKIYREREEKHISLLKGAEKQINKTLDQINILYSHNIKLGNENRKILKKLIEIQSRNTA